MLTNLFNEGFSLTAHHAVHTEYQQVKVHPMRQAHLKIFLLLCILILGGTLLRGHAIIPWCANSPHSNANNCICTIQTEATDQVVPVVALRNIWIFDFSAFHHVRCQRHSCCVV